MAVHCPDMKWLRRWSHATVVPSSSWQGSQLVRLENPREVCVERPESVDTNKTTVESSYMLRLTLCVLVLWEMIICCRFWREFHNDRVPPSGSTRTPRERCMCLFSSEPQSKMTSDHNRVSHMARTKHVKYENIVIIRIPTPRSVTPFTSHSAKPFK